MPKCDFLFCNLWGFEKSHFPRRDRRKVSTHSLLGGGGELGDGLCAFGHGVLGQLSGKEESDSGLDLSGRDGLPLVVEAKARCLTSDPLEDIVHKGVHDRHSLG